ncbi:uncharacterized protein PHALS_01062 [Plasmopara halstedii]|uniref:Uncharacterized protein n=1 Tax=Plasmopara halstedii TaxID=4781 RepID=A0A0P1AS54_PLAHL|nr:uncharacterized protein PHALS_01062 [Plasmopara halstedii]CEG44720.1 hypothetical protein PHALS_01062 [Plasmopara halstedii]|eukprot:XP_024581089.1 hypothetical protein PHALS_01062 [Plasmopara halstedii]
MCCKHDATSSALEQRLGLESLQRSHLNQYVCTAWRVHLKVDLCQLWLTTRHSEKVNMLHLPQVPIADGISLAASSS